MELSITTLPGDDGAVRVAAAGEVDLSNVADLTAAVSAAIDGHPPVVVVDLDGVTFLDSSGIGALIDGRHLADATGVDYLVINARDRVRWVLELSGVWDYLSGEPAG